MLALVAVIAATAVGACGEKDEPEPATEPRVTANGPSAPGDEANAGRDQGPGAGGARNETEKPPGGPGSGPAESGAADPRLTAAERAAAATTRGYLEAIDGRDGARLCDLLAARALTEIELPRERGGCAESLRTSIGYRDPRGLPVFDQARLAEIRSIELDGDEAKVVATVVTTFADRTQPSIEDDVIYLEPADGGWAVAKPSATLYRAVGIADVPPSVFARP